MLLKTRAVFAVEPNMSCTCLTVRYCHRFVSLFVGFRSTIGIENNHDDYLANHLIKWLFVTAALNHQERSRPLPSGMHVIKRLPRLVSWLLIYPTSPNGPMQVIRPLNSPIQQHQTCLPMQRQSNPGVNLH